MLGILKLVQPKMNCEGCLMTKQARKPFPDHTSFAAKQVLELVYGDICGRIAPETLAGNRYFLLLVDDFSRKMWVYMLKSKGEAFKAFKKFKSWVETKTEQKIKIFRTDRGGEFCSRIFTRFCEENGILRHYTAPYTPQQNRVVERGNQTVVAMTRSFLKSMELPLFLWGEAVRHSIYVLNRLPTKVLSGRTPQEAWTGKKPDLKFIKVFGCTTFMKTPATHTTKLEDRSKQVVHLGKDLGMKGYRLYDPISGSLLLSRDVTFDERKPWAWSNNADKESTQTVGGVLSVSGVSLGENSQNENNETQIVTPA